MGWPAGLAWISCSCVIAPPLDDAWELWCPRSAPLGLREEVDLSPDAVPVTFLPPSLAQSGRPGGVRNRGGGPESSVDSAYPSGTRVDCHATICQRSCALTYTAM